MRTRGFEKVSVLEFKKRAGQLSLSPERLYNDIVLPTRASLGSAGYDFYVITKFVIKPGETKVIPTGIKAYMDFDEYLGIYIRSSLALKHGIVLTNNVGIIDSDYYNNRDNEGHIICALVNRGDKDICINAGDRFVQGIFERYFLAEEEENTNIRRGGFGSTN